VLIGLIWLIRHLHRSAVGRLKLASSDRTGQLTADADATATAAGHTLSHTAGVRNCTGRVVLDRGQLVAELNPTIEPTADLDTVQAAAERASHDLHRILGRDDLYCRVQLHVARHDRAPTRVH
jgi:hypothetical protein